MRLGFVEDGEARMLRAVPRLKASDGRVPGFQRFPGPVVEVKPVFGGVLLCVGMRPADVCGGEETLRFGHESLAIEHVDDCEWIGQALLLLRLRMVETCSGESFERWIVFDCAGEVVEFVCHDLRAFDERRVESVRSNDLHALWVQSTWLAKEAYRSRQRTSVDGVILALHRVALDALLTADALRPLLGPWSLVCAASLTLATAGEREALAVGECVWVDDVMVSADSPSVLVGFAGCEPGAAGEAAYYELTTNERGEWVGARLFDAAADEDLMLY